MSSRPAAGTSRVASEPCAITSGENAYNASASVPALTAQELYGAELGAEACQLNMITTVCCLFTVPIVSLFL